MRTIILKMREKAMGVALMCAALAGCGQDLTEESGEIVLRYEGETVISQAFVPDVYAEDGCLVLRSLEVRLLNIK